MTLLKQFDDNGQEIGSEDVPVNLDNLNKCVEQYGADWLKGYAAALADIENQLFQTVLRHQKVPQRANTSHMAGRLLDVYYDKKLTPLLEAVNQLLPPGEKADKPKPE